MGRGVRHHQVGGIEGRTQRACGIGRWKSGFLVLRVACWRAWKQSIQVGLDHPEAFGHASINCGRGRRPHNRRAVTCHVQRSQVSALSETRDRACLRARSHAERGPRLRLDRRATNPGNVEGDPSIGRRWRTDDFASGSTPVACFGQRVRSLTCRTERRFWGRHADPWQGEALARGLPVPRLRLAAQRERAALVLTLRP